MREETKSIEQLKEETAREFDDKYGYEYPRCAMVMKNVEVRDEDENLIGYTNSAAVTPQELKSFLSTSQQQAYDLAMERVKSKVPKIRCEPTKCADDGVHIDYKCILCGQKWGEETQTPICLDPAIRLSDLLSLTTDKNIT